jgi:hypothetical protein
MTIEKKQFQNLQKHRTSTTRSKKGQPITAVWRNGGFSASYDSFVVAKTFVLRMNICAKNPPLRQAAKRYRSA